MTTLQTDRLKTSRTETETEDGNNHPRQPPVSHTPDGPVAVGTTDGDVDVAFPADPSYDREYDAFLTLEEAVDR